MIQRALASKGLVAYFLACATGVTLYFRWPPPQSGRCSSATMQLVWRDTHDPQVYAKHFGIEDLIPIGTITEGLADILETAAVNRQNILHFRRYKYMRHPGYFAMLISIPASAPAIGSWFALVPAIVFALVLARHTGREDKFLSYNLPSYAEYANHVPGRLFPIKKPKKDFYVKHSA